MGALQGEELLRPGKATKHHGTTKNSTTSTANKDSPPSEEEARMGAVLLSSVETFCKVLDCPERISPIFI
jgi:hypothetical protein